MRNLKDYQANYASLPFETTQARYRKRKILETVEKYRPRSILEIGCGFDPFFNYYSEFKWYTIVDPGDKFIEGARDQARRSTNITIVHGTLEENIELLRRRDYDVILLSSLLHEVPDCMSLLYMTAQLCGAKTVVHLNVPNAKSFHRILALEMGLIQSLYEKSDIQRQMQQSHTFDLETLKQMVVEAGFKVIEEGSFFIKPFSHSQMASLQEIGIVTEQTLEGLYNLGKYLPEYGSEIYVNVLRG